VTLPLATEPLDNNPKQAEQYAPIATVELSPSQQKARMDKTQSNNGARQDGDGDAWGALQEGRLTELQHTTGGLFNGFGRE
jgi:hypothetical protein